MPHLEFAPLNCWDPGCRSGEDEGRDESRQMAVFVMAFDVSLFFKKAKTGIVESAASDCFTVQKDTEMASREVERA